MCKWYYSSREVKHALMKSGNLVMGIEHFLVAFPSILLMARLMRENHLESNGISLILMCTGACNILFVLITKFRIPIFFGPSFAFIGFTSFIMLTGQENGESNIFWGRFLVAVFFAIFTVLYKFADGRKYIKLALPDALVGPLISLVGIDLLNVAIKDAAYVNEEFNKESAYLALFTLAVIIVAAVLKHKFIRNASILIGVVIGFLYALLFTDKVNFSYETTKMIALSRPHYPANVFDFGNVEWGKIAVAVLPAVIIIFSENITKVTLLEEMFMQDKDKNKDKDEEYKKFLKGLYSNSAIGQAVGCLISFVMYSVPMAVYSENIALLSVHNIEDYEKKKILPEEKRDIQKYYNKVSAYPHLIAGFIALFCSVLTFFRNVLVSIPNPVYGGMELFVFGLITAQGVMLVVNRRVNYKKITNQMITAATLVAGLSGAKITIYGTEITGLSFALLVGLAFNLVIIFLRYMGWVNERLDFMEVCEICVPLLKKRKKIETVKIVNHTEISPELFQEYIDGESKTEAMMDFMANINAVEIAMQGDICLKIERTGNEKIILDIFPDNNHNELINDLPASSVMQKENHLLITVDERISIRDLRRICKYQIVPACSKKAV